MISFQVEDSYYMRCGKYYISKWNHNKAHDHWYIFFDYEGMNDVICNFIEVRYDSMLCHWQIIFGMPLLNDAWNQIGLSLDISSAEEGKQKVELFIKKLNKLAVFI